MDEKVFPEPSTTSFLFGLLVPTVHNESASLVLEYLTKPLASLSVSPKSKPTSSEVPALMDEKVFPEPSTTSFLFGLLVPTPTFPPVT